MEETTAASLSSDAVTKYQLAADITNKALTVVIAACVEGAKLIDICILGDKTITEATDKVYNKAAKDGRKVLKGVAFPTSININQYVCHLSPLAADPEAKITLKKGDTVKIELGTHIDGHPACVGYTLVVGANKSAPVTGKTADAIAAAYYAAEASLRLLKPGKFNFDVTDVIDNIVKTEFDCTPVEGILSNEIRPEIGEGEKQIILNPTPEQRKDFPKTEFQYGEVYTIDVLVSTGDGKSKISEARTTIYKRIPDSNYSLKMQTSRKFFTDVQNKFGFMPFNLRNCEDETKARAGVVECVKNRLLLPYSVLEEKGDAIVAQCTYTALLMPNGNIQRITVYPALDLEVIKTEKTIKNEEIKALITAPVKAEKKKPVAGK